MFKIEAKVLRSGALLRLPKRGFHASQALNKEVHDSNKPVDDCERSYQLSYVR